jgi:hypothetical protein
VLLPPPQGNNNHSGCSNNLQAAASSKKPASPRPPEGAAPPDTSSPIRTKALRCTRVMAAAGHDRPPESAAAGADRAEETMTPAEGLQDFAADCMSIDLDLDGIELGFLFSPWRGGADELEAAGDHGLFGACGTDQADDDLEELLGLGDGDGHGGVPSLGDFELAWL